MAWGKAGSTTLSSAGDTIDSGTISASKCNQSMIHTISSSSTNYNLQFNSDTGSNYAYRAEYNGGTDATRTSQSKCLGNEGSAVTTTAFHVSYIFSIPSEEKLSISHTARQETAGAGTAPNRQETVGKYVNTSAITGVQLTNSDSGSFDTDSNLTALGSDMTPAAAIPFPTNVQLGSRAEITDTRKMYNLKEQPTPESTATYQVTDTSGGEVLQSGVRHISAAAIKSGSVLIGKKVSKVEFPIYRSGSPTGTATAGVFNSSATLLYTFGTIDVSTISTSTSPFVWYTFENTDSTYTLSSGEYVGVKYDGGSSSNRIIVRHDDVSPPFDGTNTVWSRGYNTGNWQDFTAIDQSFKLYISTDGGTMVWQEIGT